MSTGHPDHIPHNPETRVDPLGQINVDGVFEDETANILLVDEIDVAVLLLASCRASELGFQMSALDGLCQEDEKSSCCTKDGGRPSEAVL